MKKKILLVTTNFPPSTSIGTQRVVKICKYLSDQWQIHVLTLREKYYSCCCLNGSASAELFGNKRFHIWRTDKIDIHSFLVKIKEKFFNTPENTKIPTTKSSYSSKDERHISLGSYLKNKISAITDFLVFPDKDISWLPFSVIIGYRIINRYDIDIIFTSTPRHSNLLVVLLLKWMTGRRLVVDFRDPWARSPWLAEKRRSTSLSRLKHKIVGFMERKIIEHADVVIFITKGLRDDFRNHYFYLPSEKFKVFYNGYDPDRLRISESMHIADPALNTSPILFSHIGNLYKKRNPERLIRAIHQLINKDDVVRKRIFFRFVGNIAQDIRYIEKLVKRLNIEDMIEFIPPVDYQESFRFMQASNVLVILQPDAKIMLPAKFYDYICFDKPILALGEKESEVEKIVGHHFGIFADYSDTDDIMNKILQLADSTNQYGDKIVKNRLKYDFSKSIYMLENYFKLTN